MRGKNNNQESGLPALRLNRTKYFSIRVNVFTYFTFQSDDKLENFSFLQKHYGRGNIDLLNGHRNLVKRHFGRLQDLLK